MAPTIFADSSGFLSGPCHVSSISASRLQAPEHVNDITVYGGHHENFGGHHENFGGHALMRCKLGRKIHRARRRHRTYAARSSKLRKPARRAAQSAMAPTIFCRLFGVPKRTVPCFIHLCQPFTGARACCLPPSLPAGRYQPFTLELTSHEEIFLKRGKIGDQKQTTERNATPAGCTKCRQCALNVAPERLRDERARKRSCRRNVSHGKGRQRAWCPGQLVIADSDALSTAVAQLWVPIPSPQRAWCPGQLEMHSLTKRTFFKSVGDTRVWHPAV